MDIVIEQIKKLATKYKVKKVVLFGSRGRGDNTEVSDYDIAIIDNDLSDLDKASFCSDVEEIDTLKKIDIVFVNESLKDELMENIKRDGVTLI